MRILLLTLLALLLPACAAAPRAATGVPEDFWLSVTVMAPVDDPALPRAQRPARYLIEGDRALRVATGSGASEYTQPPLLRQLSDAQVREVYQAFRDSGVQDAPGAVSVAPTREQLGERRLVVVSYRLDARRRTLVADLNADPDSAGRLLTLADRIADMAWLPSSKAPR